MLALIEHHHPRRGKNHKYCAAPTLWEIYRAEVFPKTPRQRRTIVPESPCDSELKATLEFAVAVENAWAPVARALLGQDFDAAKPASGIPHLLDHRTVASIAICHVLLERHYSNKDGGISVSYLQERSGHSAQTHGYGTSCTKLDAAKLLDDLQWKDNDSHVYFASTSLRSLYQTEIAPELEKLQRASLRIHGA